VPGLYLATNTQVPVFAGFIAQTEGVRLGERQCLEQMQGAAGLTPDGHRPLPATGLFTHPLRVTVAPSFSESGDPFMTIQVAVGDNTVTR